MGFRFRRSVRLFPGVRLNFSASGISASVGVRGASVTVGPRGSHVNLGIPGSGLSFRAPLAPGDAKPAVRLPAGSPSGSLGPPEPPLPAVTTPHVEALGEIRSADNDSLTSLGLREFRDLLAEAYQESQRLKGEIPAVEAALQAARTRAYKWENGFLLRRLLKRKFERIRESYRVAKGERIELERAIEACRVALEIEMEGDIDSTFGALVDSFRNLAACERIWDTTAAVAVDQFRERSQASRSITRSSVELDLKPAEVVAPSRPALRFQNANGGDLYILPGFLLVYGGGRDFALVRLTEVRLAYLTVQFQERDTVPADSVVVGETWAKVNKDGSPDRRFASNFRIPVARYGQLQFRSAAGLNEEFLFSDSAKAEAFAGAFARHRATLPVS